MLKNALIIPTFIILISNSITLATQIDILSLTSLNVELYGKGESLGTATGTIVKYKNKFFLITNWHVVSGRSPATGLPRNPNKQLPDTICVWLISQESYSSGKGSSLQWNRSFFPLYKNDTIPLWIEHDLGRQVDVIALPVTIDTSIIRVHPLIIESSECDIDIQIAMNVSIIGFPRGLSGSGKLPIWKTGQIASEPEVDYLTLPAMLVDARTISGMSGSPVYLRQYGSYVSRSRSFKMIDGASSCLIGIYSGRMPVEIEDKTTTSDIGIIWKTRAVKDVLQKVE